MPEEYRVRPATLADADALHATLTTLTQTQASRLEVEKDSSAAGIIALRRDQITDALRDGLATAARVVLDAAEGGMRMSLHHGSIFEHYDAVQEARTFYGTEVTVAARIEPRVPVGAIYTTQQFAATFDSSLTDYHFEYVGKMHLAKNYGERILYRLGTNRG